MPPAHPPPLYGQRLVAELRADSARFAALRDSGAVGHHEAARKTIDHPQVGSLTLDCDVLTMAGSDLRIMIYTVEPGTEYAERLALLSVDGDRGQNVLDVSLGQARGSGTGASGDPGRARSQCVPQTSHKIRGYGARDRVRTGVSAPP